MSVPISAITTLEVIAVSADQVTALTPISTPAKVMNDCGRSAEILRHFYLGCQFNILIYN